MKFRTIIFLSSIFILNSCGNSEVKTITDAKQDSIVITTKAENIATNNTVQTADFFEIEGIYSKGGHDESIVVQIELEESGEYSGKIAELDGMLPPPELFNDIKYKDLKDFKVDLKTMKFTSKLGSGVFKNESGIQMIFDDKKDEMGDQLILSGGE